MADLTTLLSKFLDDWYAGSITVSNSLVIGNSGTMGWSDVVLSRGAANRLDLASGDSFNLVSGNVSFAGAYAFGMSGTRLAFERGGSYITGFDLFTGSLTGVAINGSGSVVLGGSASELSFGANTGAVDIVLSRGAADVLQLAQDDNLSLVRGYVQGFEQTAPAAPAADGYRIFAQDNGAGKTQLMVIFASGAAQQLAIQP